MNWGAAIRARRERKRLTRAELARQTGVSDHKLANYERGDSTPGLVDAVNLMLAVDMPLGTLAYIDGIQRELQESHLAQS